MSIGSTYIYRYKLSFSLHVGLFRSAFDVTTFHLHRHAYDRSIHYPSNDSMFKIIDKSSQ